MIMFIQFPVCDYRNLLNQKTGKLTLPFWPAPRAGQDFVRNLGQVKMRSRGGIPGWIAEDQICNAHNALKFKNPLVLKLSEDHNLKFNHNSTHFYHDGLASSKLELILRSNFPREDCKLQNVLNYICEAEIILNNNGMSGSNKLRNITGCLPKLILNSTTKNTNKSAIDANWMEGGLPQIIIETSVLDHLLSNQQTRCLALKSGFDFDLYYTWYKIGNKCWKIWIINKTNRSSKFDTQARTLRIYLTRLHTEHECLKMILTRVNEIELDEIKDYFNYEILQKYFNISTKHINSLCKKANNNFAGDMQIEQFAKECYDTANPGNQSLIEKIELLRPRNQVKKKVIEHINSINNYYVGGSVDNKIQVNQAGIVASQIEKVEGNKFQFNSDPLKDLPSQELLNELKILREELKKKATNELEHDVAVGEISQAIDSVNKSEPNKTFEHLAKAGKWALGIAQEIGVKIAVEALKKAMGIG